MLKKLVIILIIIGVLVGGFFGYRFVSGKIEDARIEKIKEGWHIEISNEFVKIRKDSDRNSAELGEAKKGDVYKVDDMENYGGNRWYHIEYAKDKWGWICNPKGTEYIDDGNNPDDIAYPTIKFFDAVYYVDSIDDINYDHIEVTDDREGVTVTHKVYHEVDEEQNKDQYWIQYIATDAVGKVTKKVQKIEFNKKPSEDQVLDFKDLDRK